MFPQTHVYFAQSVLNKVNDAITLGSIFPDMVIGAGVPRDISHGKGLEMLAYPHAGQFFQDFSYGNATHGNEPTGLDYFGDEQYPPFSKGYCFEKARPIIASTVKACNIPESMGWWKAHNIVEMGIELRISQQAPYGALIHQAFGNSALISEICQYASAFYQCNPQRIRQCIQGFSHFIDVRPCTPLSLAQTYSIQMHRRHQVNIHLVQVATLIEEASQRVTDDLDVFFQTVTNQVKQTLQEYQPQS